MVTLKYLLFLLLMYAMNRLLHAPVSGYFLSFPEYGILIVCLHLTWSVLTKFS